MYYCIRPGKAFFKSLACMAFFGLVLGLACFWSGASPALADALGTQRGKASWYGTSAEGKKTANGEIFAKRAFSAAHKTLPFGTVVRVHNPGTRKQVLVRINDRGPFSKGRIIDLSKRAAENIQMLHAGVVPVVFEPVAGPSGRPLKEGYSFYIRVTDSHSLKEVHRLSSAIAKLLDLNFRAFIAQAPQKPIALCVGPFDTFQAAAKIVKTIEKHHTVKDIVEAPTLGYFLPFHAPPKSSRSAGIQATSLK